VTAHASNNRYINDAKIIQAVAQMLSRIGIDTKAEALPWTAFFPKASNHEYSLLLGAWGANTGETSVPMRATVATPDASKGMGHSNYGAYSNPSFDALLADAMEKIDPNERDEALGKAAAFAINDAALIPLHHEVSIWATRSGIEYTARADQYTLAIGARPASK
jgi:peptide/nickel transport system substrate-binding protein